ncbi:MAG: YkgJ family cysteine cluster protein [Desulfatiglandaceae bacterium]
MKTEDQTIFQPIQGDTEFSFQCHPGIACFNHCCSKLNLTLTPYDIVNLKKLLQLDSSSFLDRYTRIFVDRQTGLPGVRLKMLENNEKSCPFLTPEGCAVYQARPAACRLYPLGRATARPQRSSTGITEKFFLVRESHCLGFKENLSWTPAEWIKHEGLHAYLEVNDPWQQAVMEISLTHNNENSEKKNNMFFMASYNLDRFRAFIFKSSFLERFDVDETTKEGIYQNDEALLLFAIEWIKFAFIGKKSAVIKVKNPGIKL